MPVLGRALAFVLGLAVLLVGLVYSVYLFGIPLVVAGTFLAAWAAGRRPLVPTMLALSFVCTVAAGFWWLGALEDGTATFYWIMAPLLTVTALASGWFAYMRR